MPLTLITGKPRNGKSLYTLQMVKAWAEREGRPVYYHNIDQLKLPWQAHDPKEWEQLPPRAIYVIDECQFTFPVRGRGQPPEWIEKLATHGHLGLDFVLITQDPMLIDNFVRRLCQRHLHVVRKFGTNNATVHEFTDGVREQVAKSRSGSIEHHWRYPKELFGMYHSADAHTVKAQIPLKVWMLIGLVVGLPLAAWWWWSSVSARSSSPTKPAAFTPAGLVQTGPITAPGAAAPGRATPLSAVEYVDQFQPRITGLAHTAPAYDQVTAPTVAPYPSACVASSTRCTCYTQQATVLAMPDQLCREIVAKGFFVHWQQQGAPARAEPRSLDSGIPGTRPQGGESPAAVPRARS